MELEQSNDVGPPPPEGRHPDIHRQPESLRTAQLIPLTDLTPDALKKVKQRLGGPVWAHFLANVYTPRPPKKNVPPVAKPIPLARIASEAFEMARKGVSGHEWVNFLGTIFPPPKTSQYNPVVPCPPPIIPRIPSAAKQAVEDIILNRNICRVNCKNKKISTIPSIQELNRITLNETCKVNNFVVTHEDIGSMTFCGNVDVFGMNLDELWDADRDTINFEFNFSVPTRIVNKNVWPKDESGRRLQQNNRDPQVLNYWTTVQKACELQKGCRYIGYDHINGIAQFNVGEAFNEKE